MKENESLKTYLLNQSAAPQKEVERNEKMIIQKGI
jgi:hypothetical protein